MSGFPISRKYIFDCQIFCLDFFVLLPQNHVSLTGVAELRIMLSRQVQSTLNMLQQDRFASDSDYLLYRMDCLVYHLNLYSLV